MLLKREILNYLFGKTTLLHYNRHMVKIFRTAKNSVIAAFYRHMLSTKKSPTTEFLCELTDEIIPNIKIDRLISFLKTIDKKFSDFDIIKIKKQLRKEGCMDFVEDILNLASKAWEEDRKTYIINLLVNALTEEFSYTESKHFARILGEIDDTEILWLRYYLVPAKAPDQEFRAKYEELLKSIYVYPYTAQDKQDTAAFQESYRAHLVRLGLLDRIYQSDPKTRLPEYDTLAGCLKIKGYDITLFGKLFLRQIGMTS